MLHTLVSLGAVVPAMLALIGALALVIGRIVSLVRASRAAHSAPFGKEARRG